MPSFVRARLVPGLLLLCLAAAPCPSSADENAPVRAAAVSAAVQPAPAGDTVARSVVPAQTTTAPAVTQSAPASDASPAASAQPEAAQPQTAADALTGAAPANSFTPSVALVRPLSSETDLPAMMISLGLVSFVGETEPIYPEEDAYAILPLGHDAVLEIYDLHYDGQELSQLERPSVEHRMGANEAYVVRVPSFGGMPARGICINSGGRRNCWNPGENGFNEGFLRWSKTKGLK